MKTEIFIYDSLSVI